MWKILLYPSKCILLLALLCVGVFASPLSSQSHPQLERRVSSSAGVVYTVYLARFDPYSHWMSRTDPFDAHQEVRILLRSTGTVIHEVGFEFTISQNRPMIRKVPVPFPEISLVKIGTTPVVNIDATAQSILDITNQLTPKGGTSGSQSQSFPLIMSDLAFVQAYLRFAGLNNSPVWKSLARKLNEKRAEWYKTQLPPMS
ncbi:hypothetical protein GGU10DRAFT_343056 [Lentinula aff. detonsa]|uniref:DUF4390 domain-containing protein n=1 Tax=Lentinula aff. detonsa TaxID=2804958 RepID=A0AA38NR11_9AGAR|nr:hypothetical protein GGU10DRAFT_343056 [Lentinula aff. detonsa]